MYKRQTEGINFKTKTSERAAKKLRFTENQATAILEMRLYKLIGLEIEALQKEHEMTLENIAKYEDILENHSSMSRVITKELQAFRKSYARPRRTQIINAKEAVFEEKKFEEIEIVFLMDRFGYCRTVDVPTFERNRDEMCIRDSIFTADPFCRFSGQNNLNSRRYFKPCFSCHDTTGCIRTSHACRKCTDSTICLSLIHI